MLSTIIKYLYLIALIAPMSILAMPITIIAPNETFTLDVEPSDSIETVKGLVEQQTSIAQARQIITFNGKVLENGRSLSDYNVQKNSTLNVTKSNAAPSFSANSPWQQVGSISSSVGDSTNLNITVDNNNTPYIIFKNGQSQAVVYKFSDTNTWELVGGSALSTDSASDTDIAFGSQNRVYAAFISGTSGAKKVVVKELVNGSWNELGTDQITGSNINHIDLKTDKNGVLYLAYDNSYSYVKKWDGTNWMSLGSQASGGRSESPEIAFNSMNELHIVSRITERIPAFVEVRKFDGTYWNSLSSTGLSGLSGVYPQIAFDSQDTPYVSLINSTSNEGPVKVLELVNNSWSEVGDTSTLAAIKILNLLIDSNDKPLIAFSEQATNGRGQLYIYENNTWSSLGQVAPADKAFYFGIRMRAAIDSANTFYAIDTTTEIGSPFVVKKTYSAFENFNKNISESTTGETLLNNVSIADTDNDEVTLTVTLSDTQFGSLSGTASGSASISYDESTGILTLSGTLTDVNASIASIVFNGTASGAGDFTLSFTVNDGTASSSTIVGSYSVKAVNDPPSVSINTGLTVSEGDLKVITNSLLAANDSDDSGVGLTYTLKSVPTNGSLFVDANDNGSLDSGEELAMNGSFTQQTLDDSKLYYKHNGTETNSDSFTFDLADGGEDEAAAVTNQTFAITVSLVNDAPMFSIDPTWEYVGKANFTNNSVDRIKPVYDKNGILHVAYTYQNNGANYVEVMKYSNDEWVSLGDTYIAQARISSPLSISFNSQNIPYIAYNDVDYNATVQKYENDSWQKLEGGPLTSSYALHTVLQFDSADNLYLAFQDLDVSSRAIGIHKWDGDSWSMTTITASSSLNLHSIKLAFDSINTPYIAYNGNDGTNYLNVKKLVDNNWVNVGSDNFEDRVTFVDLEIHNDVPYIAMSSSSRIASVKLFNGSEWVLVGNNNFTGGEAYSPDLAFDSNSIPHLALTDVANEYRLTVMKFYENEWVSLDKQGFSNKVSRIPAFVIDQNDNPVAIYSDLENGGSISVIKYEKPVFDSYSLTVDEDSGATSLFKSLKTADEEGDDLTLTVTLGNSTSGELTGTASLGATLNYSSETATFTLSGSLEDVNASLASITFTPAANFSGLISIKFDLSDGNSSAKAVSGTITVTGINDTPSITSSAPVWATEDSVYSYKVQASDADMGDTLTFSAIGLPSWLTMDAKSGVLSGTPTNDDVGTHYVAVVVSDSLNASDRQDFVINVANVNDKPVITSSPITVALEDAQYSYTVTASDVDSGDSLSYTVSSAQGLPSWLSYDPVTRTLTGIPTNDDVGTYSITVVVTDTSSEEARQLFTLTVTNVNDAPVISSTPITTATEDSVYNYTVSATDVDKGDTLIYSAKTLPNWLSIDAATGLVTGTPSNDDVGIHTVSLTVTDSAKETDSQLFSITVENVNDAPVFSSTPITTATEDELYSYTASATDDDAGDTLFYTALDMPSWLTFDDATRTLTGTPTNDDVGTYNITLVVTDASKEETKQEFILNVVNVNDVPDVHDDTAIVDEDNSVAINILANDSDVDNDLNPASVRVVTAPMLGKTSLNTANGVITYTPNENVNGSDSFTYTVDDLENGRSAIATVSITINPVNDAPFAKIDTALTEEDMAIEIDVALNDSDLDEGDSLDLSSLEVVTAPENGKASVQNKRILYTPNADFNGNDTFTYRVADESGAMSNQASVMVTVGEVNDAPIALNDAAELDEDASIELSILDNDLDVDSDLTIDNVTITQAPAHGKVSINSASGTISYKPNADFFGSDSFTYSVKDDQSLISNIAVVKLTVNSVNDAPVANNDVAQLLEDTAHSINVLGNDLDVDGSLDKSSLEVVTEPEHGSTQIVDGMISYTPNANSNGEDSFSYRVKDDLGVWSNNANVFITITAVNDAPLANNDVIQIDEDESVIIDVTGNDSDVDGSIDEDSVKVVTEPAFGNVINNVDGTVSYTPVSNYVGFDSFTYSVLDNEGAESNTASVTITVLAVNDAPMIESAPVTSATQDEAYSYVLIINDVDSADSYKLSATELPSWLDFNPATGELSGTPSNDDVGTHAVTLLVTDAEGLTDTQTFVITVADVNDEATGGISISGEAKQGETLRVESTIDDPDGLGEFTYQWMRNGVLITGATLSEYMLTDADIGATITVVVTYVDGNGNTETFTSGATSPVIISNVAPVAIGEQFSTDEDESITFTLGYFDENGDELTFNLVTPVSNGTLTVDANRFMYQPSADFSGSDSFSYSVSDGVLTSELATVTIVVNQVNDAPVATPDNFTVNADLNEYVVLDVLANDIDVDGDALTLVHALASVGSIRIVDNKLEYLPPVGLNADVTITYQIKDASGEVVDVTLIVKVVSTVSDITITAPEDKTIASEGLFTKVNMGTAVALDSLGNPVRVTASSKGFFASGTHTVVWSAGEGSDQVTATQLIHVIPQVNFSKDQTATEGTSVIIKAILNGDAVTYPVIVPFTVSGDAIAGDDHDLSEGEFTFKQGQREAMLIVNLIEDDVPENTETLTVHFQEPKNAVVGPLGSHTLTIAEGNVAPSVELFAAQQGMSTRLIDKQAGEVTISALVTDANLADTHVFDWQVSDAAIIDADSIDDQFSFDPSVLAEGVYEFMVTVDDGDKTGSVKLSLTVLDSLPKLAAIDSDFDGINDDEEGYADSDNDGIPDYLDASSLASNVVQEKLIESEFFLMETEPGLHLSLGNVAFKASGSNTSITEDDAVKYGHNGLGANADDGFDYISGVFDFNVNEIPVAGQSVSIVIAQFSPIPSNAIYRKLMPTGWTEFVVDSRNSIASAPGAEGFCPPPQDTQYTQGLSEGHWCVQLTIEDGGPNDADGQVNRAIEDPSGIATLDTNNSQPVAMDDVMTVKRNISAYLDVLANDTDADGDLLTLTSATVDIGEVSIINNELHFNPQAEHLGTATISYGVSDGNGGSAFATVTVEVVENTAPQVSAIIDVTTDGQQPVNIDILANVTDDDNNDFTIISASADNGTVVINDDGTITYTPNVGFDGTDTVTFIISDGDGGTTQGQFNVVVKAYKQVNVEHKTSGGALPLSLISLLLLLMFIRCYQYRARC
ncbi:Ig-like domain-containing protein [Pseudoalteromonas shioyasakiensis]|uniref:Ig-like domain-containing protein n=1 Tax=Pseudoalteromonas shioyasakiensis TaxID=1190813 RepID=UPI0020956970|nr:Ig-like domain-containing protein [Pseudoalteromonas shioyasakiensis]